MAKTVRKGSWYRYRAIGLDALLFNPELRRGATVQVVNLPGGLTSGNLRNVRDIKGNTYLVNIVNLDGPVPNPAKFQDLYR